MTRPKAFDDDPTPIEIPVPREVSFPGSCYEATSLLGLLACDGTTSYPIDCPVCNGDAELVVEERSGHAHPWHLTCSDCGLDRAGIEP